MDLLSVDGDTYISWAVGNDGSGSVDYPFFVDVYLDGVLAERWSMPGLGADEVIALTDWEKLKERIRLEPGSHTLRLVVDPTDLVPELDEQRQRLRGAVHLAGPVRACGHARSSTEPAAGPGSGGPGRLD